MKRITTSAQKTVSIDRPQAFKHLRDVLEAQEKVRFMPTSNPDIHKAKMPDGTTLAVASFDKPDGGALMMIDHSGVPESDRNAQQSHWRHVIDEAFIDKLD